MATPSQREIKRDMEGRSAAVRIMTIHGAKGLEAPIVFLPDTCRPPVKRGGSVDRLQFNDQYLPLWRASRALLDDYSAAQVARREEQAAQEERRLLYVAMTRARDRLYIGGWLGKRDKQPAEGSWYQMIAAALEGPTATAGETLAQQLAAGEVTLQKKPRPTRALSQVRRRPRRRVAVPSTQTGGASAMAINYSLPQRWMPLSGRTLHATPQP